MRLRTQRLHLEPIRLPLVEAVLRGDRETAERIAEASLPSAWPGRVLIERAFSASLENIVADPDSRLWGDRLMVLERDGKRWIVGSVIFHGRPSDDGIAEVGYGVEEDSQRQGYATEAVMASVEWALAQPECRLVQATTFPWNVPSIRVLEKIGMKRVDTRDHDLLGEMWIFERAV
jgi:RimJ/RimL family protein N-acetyltransferase